MTGGVSRQFNRTVVAFEDEVSTESGSDRVIVLAISIIAIGFYPVATALGTDSMTSAGFLPQIRPLPVKDIVSFSPRRKADPKPQSKLRHYFLRLSIDNHQVCC